MSSCNWWEFLPFLQGRCQSTCTALMAAGWARRMWNSLASTRYAVHGWCTHNVPSHWLFFRLILNSMEIIFCCHVIIKSLYLSIRLEPHLNTASISHRICQASQNHSQKTPHHPSQLSRSIRYLRKGCLCCADLFNLSWWKFCPQFPCRHEVTVH